MSNFTQITKGSNIANRAWDLDHKMNFDDRHVIDKGNYRSRKTLESWHTAKTMHVDNNSKKLSEQCAKKGKLYN